VGAVAALAAEPFAAASAAFKPLWVCNRQFVLLLLLVALVNLMLLLLFHCSLELVPWVCSHPVEGSVCETFCSSGGYSCC